MEALLLRFAVTRFILLLLRFLSVSTGALLAPAAFHFVALRHLRRVRRP